MDHSKMKHDAMPKGANPPMGHAGHNHQDIILIKPGEKVAADGIITEDKSYLNESMLTGEIARNTEQIPLNCITFQN